MSTTRVLPDSIQLATPREWDEFPVDPDEFTEFRRRTLERLQAEQGVDRAAIRQVEVFLVDLHRLVRRERLIFAAGFLGQADADAEGTESEPVLAAVAATSIRRAEFGTDVPLLPEVLIRAFAEGESRREREAVEEQQIDGNRTTTTFDHIEPPATESVNGHEAVRLRRLLRATGPQRDPRSLFLESYLIPVAEGDAVIMLQFATPNLDLAKPLSTLFNRIAGTIRILYPDDPTFVDDPIAAASDASTTEQAGGGQPFAIDLSISE